MGQKFIAREPFAWPNGATGWRPGGPFDCLGPYAKIQNCPVVVGDDGEVLRLTCYATGYPDTAFSVPACTKYRGRHITGYFALSDDGPQFRVRRRHWGRMGAALAPHFDRFDICAAYARTEADYNVGGVLQERAGNIRRRMSTGYQLARMRYRPSPIDDGMTPNAWAIYSMLQERYGFKG